MECWSVGARFPKELIGRTKGLCFRSTFVGTPNPADAGCNSQLAQYSNTPSLRVAGFEDDDEDENEAPHTVMPADARRRKPFLTVRR
jgi:hypothetical protein